MSMFDNKPDVSGEHKATRLIKETFAEKGLKFGVDVHEDVSVVRSGFKGDVAPGLEVLFFSADDDNDVTIRSGVVVNVPKEKFAQVNRVINQCNMQYRFIKFIMNDDGDVRMSGELLIETMDQDVGECAYGMLMRMAAIYDRAYPMIMKVLWGE